MKMDERYSGHDIALFKACLSPEIFPSLKQNGMKAGASKLINDEKR